MQIRLFFLVILWLAAGGCAWAVQGQATLAIAILVIAAVATVPIFLVQNEGPPSSAQLARRAEAEAKAKKKRLAQAEAKTKKEQAKAEKAAAKPSKKEKEKPAPKGDTTKPKKAVAASSKK